MGIFDIIELKQHVRSIGEYIFYIDSHCEPSNETEHCLTLITGHLKQMSNVLDNLEKNP